MDIDKFSFDFSRFPAQRGDFFADGVISGENEREGFL